MEVAFGRVAWSQRQTAAYLPTVAELIRMILTRSASGSQTDGIMKALEHMALMLAFMAKGIAPVGGTVFPDNQVLALAMAEVEIELWQYLAKVDPGKFWYDLAESYLSLNIRQQDLLYFYARISSEHGPRKIGPRP